MKTIIVFLGIVAGAVFIPYFIGMGISHFWDMRLDGFGLWGLGLSVILIIGVTCTFLWGFWEISKILTGKKK